MKRLLARGRTRDDMSTAQILVALFLVNFVSIAGFGMLLPVFAVYGEQIGASGTEIAWAIASFSLGQLVSGIVFGRLSDQHGRKPLMVIGTVGSSLLYIVHLFADTPELLILVRFAAGITSGSFALSFAVGSDISTPATRARVLGVVGAGFSFGFIFGPAIGGFAAGLVSQELAFKVVCLVSAGLSCAAALAVLTLLPETRRVHLHREGTVRPRIRDLLRQLDFFTVLAVCLAATIGMSMLHGVFVLFANDVLYLGPMGIGLMYTTMGVFGVLTQAGAVGPVAAAIGEHRMMVVAMLIVSTGMVALGFTATVEVALLAMIAVAIGYSLVNTASSALASMIAPEALQGAALGLVQSVISLGRFIGPMIAGPLYDFQGPAAPFFWGAGLIIVFAAGAALWQPAATHRGHPDNP